MLISRYTFLFENEGLYYIYNSLSNALVEIDQTAYSLLKEVQLKNGEISMSDLEESFIKMLIDKRFICNSLEDELLYYKALIQPLREQREFMHLTIAPTMDCCFSCFYCFEHNKSRKYMSSDVMDSIIKYVSHLSSLKKILLSWFGGEPLMAPDIIRTFYKRLRESFDGEIISDIITTGYHIDKNIISLFKEIGISSIQITLDGNREQHNKVKYIEHCDDVFTKTLNNIKFLVEECPEIEVVFRVNLTKKNADEYPELFKQIYKMFGGKRISVSPAIVKNRSKANTCSVSSSDVYFSKNEFTDYLIDLLYTHGIVTPFIKYPSDKMCECAIRDKMALAFDPEGYAYKCWEKIGDKKYAVGRLNLDGILTDLNITELNRELYGADPLCNPVCTRCKYLPICNGGCPLDRLQNEFEGCNNELCAFSKGRINDFLRMHLMLKGLGFDNK